MPANAINYAGVVAEFLMLIPRHILAALRGPLDPFVRPLLIFRQTRYLFPYIFL